MFSEHSNGMDSSGCLFRCHYVYCYNVSLEKNTIKNKLSNSAGSLVLESDFKIEHSFTCTGRHRA